MNKLTTEKRTQIVAALVEGNSIRSTARMTGASKVTILKLLADLGVACAEYQHKTLRNLPCKKIQADEIWSFCYARKKNVPAEKRGQFGYGDVWTWTAICADTKIAACWMVGGRDVETAHLFLDELATRLSNRIQLTTDGLKAYLVAVPGAFKNEIDFGTLVKMYGPDPREKGRYSPPECIYSCKMGVIGNPEKKHISTSFVERQNLTMRMSMRRFTRLTNAFSKKVDNLRHAVNLHFMFYNFARIHQTLRITPAMAAGVSDHVWEIEEIVGLLA